MRSGGAWGALLGPPSPIILDDEPRDTVAGGTAGERVAGEPPRVLELVGVDGDLAARVLGDEAHHELARERPVLAADVLDVLHVDADFLLHLALHRALQTLAVVDEPRDERVASGRPARLAREEHAVAVAHEHDHRRVQVRIVLVATARAAFAPLTLEPLRPVP